MSQRRANEALWMQLSRHAEHGCEDSGDDDIEFDFFISFPQTRKHCEINGLVCLNEHYEDLSIVIASWSKARKRKGIVCNCIPSCNEVDILTIYEARNNIFDPNVNPYSIIEVALANLPTERYKRNVVRGKLDLVGKSSDTRSPSTTIKSLELNDFLPLPVSVGGSTGLFVGASLLSFVEVIYYFTIRAGLFNCLNVFKKSTKLSDVFTKMQAS